MRSWTRWMYVVTGLAAVFVAVAAGVQAVRQGSWGPVAEVGWLPAVMVATWPGSYSGCGPRRRGAAR